MKNAKLENGKYIYVFQNEIGNVKNGVSKNPKQRLKALENQTGVRIINTFTTPQCSNSLEIEKLIHKEFKNKTIFGEWFNISFGYAVDMLKEYFKKTAKFEERKSNSLNIVKYFHPELF